MAEPDDDEMVSKKVVYEHVATSGSSRSNLWTILIIVVIAAVLVGFIVMHLHH